MSNNVVCRIQDLLDLFNESVTPADVLASKLMSQISTAITKERLKLHMNQSQFAEHIGITQSIISRWEHGDYNFSIKKVAEIASKLNLDVNVTINDISMYKTMGNSELERGFFHTRTLVYSGSNFSSNATDIYRSNIKEGHNYASIR